jgi:hypothetical protein
MNTRHRDQDSVQPEPVEQGLATKDSRPLGLRTTSITGT